MTDLSNQTNLNSDEIVLTDEERQPCEVWTRVMGYHRPVASSTSAKRASIASASTSRNAAPSWPPSFGMPEKCKSAQPLLHFVVAV